VCGWPRLYCVLYQPLRSPKEMSAQCQRSSCASSTRTPRKPILVNPDHVRTATEADSHKTVRLVIGEAAEEVEGDLKSVWETLTGGSHPQARDEHLTWTRRDPEGD
jgi:hypothetical protein